MPPAASPLWVQGLRSQLRQTLGPAWRLTEQRGKAKLDVRFRDGSRKTAVLPIPWLPAQARAIQDAVEQVAAAVAAGVPLMDAVTQIRGASDGLPPSSGNDRADLIAVWEQFGRHKVGTGQIKESTWIKDYSPSAKRVKAVAVQAHNAKDFLQAVAEPWQPGCRRRQVVVQHVASMLRWACDEGHLAAEPWMPPASLRRFIGDALPRTEAAVPLRDQEILDLLESLPVDSAGRRWRFVLQLLAAYGLRPVEVQYLQQRPDGQLRCLYQKRSGGGTTRPRVLKALHPEWEVEWQLRERLHAGEAMPPFGGGVADAARRYLIRQSSWQQLAEKGATVYGFRHGYALRAHQNYGLSPRVAAALMGHSVDTHQRAYGTWTDASTIDQALEAGLRYREATKPVKTS